MRHFDSTVFRASQALLEYLQRDFIRPLDQAHSSLTQGFHMPSPVATAVLKKQIPCRHEGRGFVVSDTDYTRLLNEHQR